MINIRLAVIEDAASVAKMLKNLADDIGDADWFCTDAHAIRTHGFGNTPLFHSVIAERGSEHLGLALYFPGYSTTMAVPGLYVQDLWIAEPARGAGLGKRLLSAAARHAAKAWGAEYLALTVYEDNPRAQKFYEGLGFGVHKSENPTRLSGQKFKALKARA